MKKMKKGVVILLACTLTVVMLAACGGGNGAGGSGGKTGGRSSSGKTKIGVMHFTWTSRIATSLMDYLNNYLGPAFDVEFTTYTCGFDNNSCISTVENMITAGEDGLILLVSSGITEVEKLCTEAEVPFALIQGKPTVAEEEILAKSASKEFVLCVHPETDAREGGRHEAQVMLDQGYKRCAIITTPVGMIEAGDQEDEGFVQAFTEGGGTIVDEKREIPGAAMVTAADTVLATHGDEIDFLYGLLDVLQSIVTDPKYADKGIKIVSNELPSDGGVAMFESGVLAFCHEKIPQQAGLALAAILNYLNGDSYSDAPVYKTVESPYTDIFNADDCRMFLAVTNGTDGYNDFCEEKYDPLFGKNRRFMRPIQGPAYYAASISIGAYGSLGGILIDSDFRVLTSEYEVIKGLYGAGSDVNDIYDGSYVFTFPGNTMGFAVNSGRIAGENAAEYVRE